jgi:hypothetical protein
MKFNDKIISIDETIIKKYDYYDRDFIYTVGYVNTTTNGTPIIFVSELNNWFYQKSFKVVTEKDIRKMKLNRLEKIQ